MFKWKQKGIITVISIRKIAVTAIILAISVLCFSSITADATGPAFPQSLGPYSISTSSNSEAGQVEKVVVSGGPLELEAVTASVPEPDVAMGINVLLDVPAFDWSYGCSATSAAMLFGYYDRTGYSNMYTGPTNGGVCPPDNSVWGETVYPGVTSNECPLSATHQGIDGRESSGHVDDYWIDYQNTDDDPYITNGWEEHTPGDCTGDFMGTNQSFYGNADGASIFFYEPDGSPLYDFTELEPAKRDGCHGMRLFAESRGYEVVTNFTQKIEGAEGTDPGLGFTFEDFQSEIDAGRPVLIHVTDHTMLGYGYNTTSSAIYIHDTFDEYAHTMTWGSTYLGMQHYGVTVIQLVALTPPSVTTNAATGIFADSATLNGNLDSLGDYSLVDVSFEWGTISGSLYQETPPQAMTSTGIFTADLGSLIPDTTYYFRAKATGYTSVYGPELSFMYDSIIPEVAITDIDNFVNDLDTVSGTASDTYPGELQKVQVILENTTDGTYWNGSDWVLTETWLDAFGTTSWNYTLPALGDGQTYMVKSKSIDMAGNESTETADIFTCDTNGPSATINDIADFVNGLDTVSGTASDISPGALQKVQVILVNTNDSKYWNGSDWVSTETWLEASGTASWSYTLPALGDGQTYRVKAKSIDMAGNESTETADIFTCDTNNPSVTITDIDDFVNDLDTVSGTASDTYPGELQKVQVLLENTTDGTYWNGSDWVSPETWFETSGTTSWSYTVPTLTDGKVYQVKSKSIDMAGNESTETADTFTCDTNGPSVTLADIDGPVSVLDIVSGTAYDTLPGALQKVQVILENVTDSKYWDGASWEDDQIWLDASGTSSWSYTVPTLTDGKTYQIKAKSIDMAGNESTEVTDIFPPDITSPSAAITNIDDFVNDLDTVSGTASDISPGELYKVEIVLKNTTDSKYWNGSDWVSPETWLDASGTSSWSYTVPTLTGGKVYQVKARSIDMAGNESTEAADTFTCDTNGPSVTVNDIDDFVNGLDTVSGTASDLSPGELQKIQMMLENTTDGTYWNGSDWVSPETWLDASGTSSWSYTVPTLTGGKVYQVKARSIDMAGNESTEVTDTFTCDTSSPSVTITDIDDFVNGLDTVSGTASDLSPGELQKIQMMLENTTDGTYWNGSDWVSTETWLDASGTSSWSYTVPTLTGGKVYQVKARSIDMAGNESTEVTDTFTCDTSSPSVTITDIDDFVNGLDTVSGTASDLSPGELQKIQMMLENTTDGTYWNGSDWVSTETWFETSGTTSWSYTVPTLTDSKVYQVKAKSIDFAGNESAEATDTFTDDTNSPSVTINDIDDFVNGLDTVSGTTSDISPGELQKVQVMLENTTDSKYWDGDSWEDDQIWLDASGTASWSYALPVLTDGKFYRVNARSIDMAGNESTIYSDAFTCDTDKGGFPITSWLIGTVIAGCLVSISLVFLFRFFKHKI